MIGTTFLLVLLSIFVVAVGSLFPKEKTPCVEEEEDEEPLSKYLYDINRRPEGKKKG